MDVLYLTVFTSICFLNLQTLTCININSYFFMNFYFQITSPTLVLKPEIVQNNLENMISKASRLGLKLVPHFKTPQSREIGKWAFQMGIKEITVSSIKMAKYLSEIGFNTIHIAFPFNIREIDTFNQLNEHQNLSIQIVNVESARFLTTKLVKTTSFYIEIDAGYGRTGVKFNDFETIDTILSVANDSNKLKFRGFYLHPGHTYYGDIQSIYYESRTALNLLKSKYASKYPEMGLRIGDTPGCSIIDDFGPATEIGPGNFLFYDLMQVSIGSCKREDIALVLAVPVVDINKNSGKILVHGGGVHLSKDFIQIDDGSKCFGEVVLLNDSGWKFPNQTSRVVSISQEHGIIQATQELLSITEIGDLIGILPVHSCMTADCMKKYWSTNGGWIDHAESY